MTYRKKSDNFLMRYSCSQQTSSVTQRSSTGVHVAP